MATSSHSDNFSIPTVEMRKLQRMREVCARCIFSVPCFASTIDCSVRM